MNTLVVPAPVREKLRDAACDGLIMMFAEAHRIGTEQLDARMAAVSERFDCRLNEVSERFDRRLDEEISSFRVEMIQRIADLRFDLLKWNFLFWIGQLAALTAILSVMLRGLR